MSRARTQKSPALVASALVHAGVLAAALIVWPMVSKPLPLGKVVPVTLVTSDPPAEQAAAVQAPVPAPAATPTPEPEAPPEPAPIRPAPPAPPAAAAAPKPALKTKPTPAKRAPSIKAAPTASTQAANKQDLDLDALMASIDTQRTKPAAKAASGQAGPLRPKTEKTASAGKGQDDHLSGSELGALQEKLNRLWNPNCQVQGAGRDAIRVHVRLTAQGYLIGQPELMDKAKIDGAGNAMLSAAATRALSAAGRAQPYTDVLMPEHYEVWRDMILKFDPKSSQCGG